MLDAGQIAFFGTEGYLVLEDVFDPAPLHIEYGALLDHLYDGWFEEGAVSVPPDGLDYWAKLRIAYAAGCDWFQPMDCSLPGDTIHADTPFHFGPAIFDLIRTPRLLDIVESLIGSEITSNPIQHIRIKPPATALHPGETRAHITATDWHQDRAVAHEEADRTAMVTVWCAVTDATPQNGCLQVIPGGHRADMLPHCPKTQTGIADGFIDEGRALPLPVREGGVILFHPLTPHASLVNRTDDFRWSFDIRYNRTDDPTGRAHFPEFIARSRTAPDTELHDWRAWRQLWQDARTRLAIQPHIPIHRWTSDAPYCA